MPEPPANDVVLEIRGLSYRVGRKEILRDVSFSVRRGEYLSIVGPNGAGKTTLLKCVDRLVAASAGEIRLMGRPLGQYRPRSLAKRVSYVPQADGQVIPFSVRQFVLMGRYPYLSPFSSIDPEGQDVVDEALRVTGTIEFAQRRLDSLSGGERQKVYIAAALAQRAEILLLDEPTTFLDYRHQSEIRDLLAGANRDAGVTILCVTHDLNRAALDSDRIVAMKAGTVALCGTPQEIMDAEVLEGLFQTPFTLAEHPQAGFSVIVPDQPRRDPR